MAATIETELRLLIDRLSSDSNLAEVVAKSWASIYEKYGARTKNIDSNITRVTALSIGRLLSSTHVVEGNVTGGSLLPFNTNSEADSFGLAILMYVSDASSEFPAVEMQEAWHRAYSNLRWRCSLKS